MFLTPGGSTYPVGWGGGVFTYYKGVGEGKFIQMGDFMLNPRNLVLKKKKAGEGRLHNFHPGGSEGGLSEYAITKDGPRRISFETLVIHGSKWEKYGAIFKKDNRLIWQYNGWDDKAKKMTWEDQATWLNSLGYYNDNLGYD